MNSSGTNPAPYFHNNDISHCIEYSTILFLVFINDISHCIKYSTIRCFLMTPEFQKPLSVKALQDDLDAIVEWSIIKTLHKDKFEYICHSANNTNHLRHLPFVSQFYQYKTSMDILSLVQHLKDLGILARQDLSWFKHIRSTCDKARQKACWVLISVFFIRSPAAIKALASAQGSEKRKKIRKKIVPVPIYVFVDSEQKAEFKAKIKLCSHQLNCMKFLMKLYS